jgi:hypothetical protein
MTHQATCIARVSNDGGGEEEPWKRRGGHKLVHAPDGLASVACNPPRRSKVPCPYDDAAKSHDAVDQVGRSGQRPGRLCVGVKLAAIIFLPRREKFLSLLLVSVSVSVCT